MYKMTKKFWKIIIGLASLIVIIIVSILFYRYQSYQIIRESINQQIDYDYNLKNALSGGQLAITKDYFFMNSKGNLNLVRYTKDFKNKLIIDTSGRCDLEIYDNKLFCVESYRDQPYLHSITLDGKEKAKKKLSELENLSLSFIFNDVAIYSGQKYIGGPFEFNWMMGGKPSTSFEERYFISLLNRNYDLQISKEEFEKITKGNKNNIDEIKAMLPQGLTIKKTYMDEIYLYRINNDAYFFAEGENIGEYVLCRVNYTDNTFSILKEFPFNVSNIYSDGENLYYFTYQKVEKLESYNISSGRFMDVGIIE